MWTVLLELQTCEANSLVGDSTSAKGNNFLLPRWKLVEALIDSPGPSAYKRDSTGRRKAAVFPDPIKLKNVKFSLIKKRSFILKTLPLSK